MPRLVITLSFALLAACSHDDPQPGGLTADDQQQLNDAAAMLDNNSVQLNQVSNEATP